MLDQHLWSTLNVVRPVVPRMVAAGHGRLVAVSSPMATAPAAGMGTYAVGKAAEETLLAALAREVAGTGVTANVVRVRTIDTSGVRVRDPLGKGVSMHVPGRSRPPFAPRSGRRRGRQRRAHRVALGAVWGGGAAAAQTTRPARPDPVAWPLAGGRSRRCLT